MARVVVKSSDIGKKMHGMFAQMMGVQHAEKEVILPKIQACWTYITRAVKILESFASTDAMTRKFPEFDDNFKEILQFCSNAKKTFETTYSKIADGKLESLQKSEANDLYKSLKEDKILTSVITISGNLKEYSANFEQITDSTINFINSCPGFELKLFPFSSLNFKLLWGMANTMDSKKFIYMSLKLLYESGNLLYQTIITANVDPDEFAQIMSDAFSDLKKIPGMNRCQGAFSAIQNSTDLLKNNMNKYYQEAVLSGSMSNMFSSFLNDVINDVSNSNSSQSKMAALKREFATIFRILAQQNKSKSRDPKFDALIKNVQKTLGLNRKDKPTTEVKTETKSEDVDQDDDDEEYVPVNPTDLMDGYNEITKTFTEDLAAD